MDIVKKVYYATRLDQMKLCYGKIKNKFVVYENLSKKKAWIKAIKVGRCIPLKTDKVDEILTTLMKSRIEINITSQFVYFIDEYTIPYSKHNIIDNMPIDYHLIVDNSLKMLLKQNMDIDTNIAQQNIKLIKGIIKYINYLTTKLSRIYLDDSTILRYLSAINKMIDEPAENIHDAFQRILFWNQILWQTQHKLVGLGRLDVILDRFEKEATIEDVDDFLSELAKYYQFKSSAMLGDTGQLVIIGGIKENGDYFCNMLTYMFLESVTKALRPEPKILIRCSRTMPDRLLKMAVQCLLMGKNGSPLFSNDDVIVPALMERGYSRKISCDHVTSACWEPVINGCSFGQNNCGHINFVDVLVGSLSRANDEKPETFDGYMSIYLSEIKKHIHDLVKESYGIRWEPDPIMDMFIEGCAKNNKDICDGGALYNDIGFLSLGISNAVDSLLFIKEYVYEEKTITLHQAYKYVIDGDHPEIIENVECRLCFGQDHPQVIDITNLILDETRTELDRYTNRFSGKYKFGLSSPAYIQAAKGSKGSLDGRKANDPYNTHISSKKGLAYTELINFAGNLDYSGISSNGNVLDLMLNDDISESELFMIVKVALKKGVFQMQFNILSYEQLIDAKKNPEKYPHLMVRVWGFSAYFVDLTEEYQDLLIERARLA